MKKILFITLLLTSVLLIAEQEVIVRVNSNADAEGTIYIYEDGAVIAQTEWGEADINNGITDFPFDIPENSDLPNLEVEVQGGTNWGAFSMVFGYGFYGYTPVCNVNIYFSYPVNIETSVYSNMDVDNAQIHLRDYYGILETITSNLEKGWNTITFDDYYNSSFSLNDCYIEVVAQGVANESYNLSSSYIIDMYFNEETGYYESDDLEFTFDNKPLHSDWNWESFPKLPENSSTNNGEQNIVPLFQSYLLPGNYSGVEFEIQDDDLDFDGYDWNPLNFNIQSSDGTKLKPTGNSDYYYVANGTRVNSQTTINLDAGVNWIGYWLPHSLRCDVAFGEHWDKVKYIKAEDWAYTDLTPERPNYAEPISTRPRPIHYGEGYEIYLREPIPNFQWSTNYQKPDNYRKEEPEFFTAEVKSDYEVIDIVNIDPEIMEIGVFDGNICIGAVKVEGEGEQILVYSDAANRGSSVLTFQVATGRSKLDVLNYKILYSDGTKEYDNLLIGGQQNYTMLEFGKLGEQEVALEVTSAIVLHPNYPNPFNPETRISFELPEKANVTIAVYNLKGQKVKTLASGAFEAGLQTVVWNGVDDKENPVASGVYLYRLESETKTISRKMMLLK